MNLSDIGSLTFEHLYLVIIGTLIGGGVGFVLAIWMRRRPQWAAALIGLAEVIQTLPGIALLAFLLLAFGLGNAPVIVALGLYAILLAWFGVMPSWTIIFLPVLVLLRVSCVAPDLKFSAYGFSSSNSRPSFR